MFSSPLFPAHMHAFVVFNRACYEGRRAVSCTRPNQVIACILIGYLPASGTTTIAEMLQIRSKACYRRLSRMRKDGYLTYSNRQYHLTEQGQKVYDAAMAVLNTEIPALTKWLAAQAREEMKSADLVA